MDMPAESGRENSLPCEHPVQHVPIIGSNAEQHQAPTAFFEPIKPENSPTAPILTGVENEDSNDKRLSREDIETMEILQSKATEDSKTSWPDTHDTEALVSTPLNDSLLANDISQKEDSVASSTGTRNTDPILKQSSMFSAIAAADLIEYQWPADGTGDYYMLQEQISTFLGITSFKRKYPEIERRKLDPQELNHLLLNMLLSEVQVTLGLTAVRSRDVCDMMMREYPEKYQEYIQVLDEKRKESIKNKHLQYSAVQSVFLVWHIVKPTADDLFQPSVEKSQMPNYLKKAMKQVSDFNARLNRQRKDEYSVYYDMQTNVLQFPKHKMKKLHPDLTRPSLYPCALIPGQFQEYCQKYTCDELNYFPLNTAVYGPPPPPPDNVESMKDSDSEGESKLESVETETADTSQMSHDDGEKAEGVANSVQQGDEKATTNSDNVLTETKQDDLNTGEVENSAEEEPERDKLLDSTVSNNEADESIMSYIDDPDKPICGICLKDETSNKKGEPEDLISCSQCDNYGHPSCLDMSRELVSVIVTYNWQCLECKTCTYCSKPHHEDKMMFCDRCDRGYHTFCVGLRNLPSGLWMCPQCTRSDPDFAKKGGKPEKGSATPRKRKNSDSTGVATPPPSDTPGKQRRKRRTKKEMEEARERERQEKEEKLKKKQEKREEREERKKRRRQKKEEAGREKNQPEQNKALSNEIPPSEENNIAVSSTEDKTIDEKLQGDADIKSENELK